MASTEVAVRWIAQTAVARARSDWLPVPLLLVLLVQATVSSLLLRNTAFQDEALYIFAGKEMLRALLGGAPPMTDYATFLSGYPYFYPLLAGILNQVGGLETVRLFSTACMMVTTLCVFSVSRQVFSPTAGYIAALLFAIAGPTLFLSRLATYDALALMLLAVATVIALKVSTARGPAGAIALAPLLVLAVAAKYAALLFVPFVIGILATRTLELRGWKRALVHVGVALVAIAWVALAISFLVTPDVRAGISFTTTDRTAVHRSPMLELLGIIASLGGPLWGLALIGLVFSVRRQPLTVLGLLLASLAAPAYHLYTGEHVSIQKHIGFGLFFASPLAGFAVAELARRAALTKQVRGAVYVVSFLALATIGVSQAQWWYHSWPDSAQLVATVRPALRGSTSHCLCEDVEVMRYYLANTTQGTQFIGLEYFQYTDAFRHSYTGEAAYVKAIEDGYFDVVELNFAHPPLSEHLRTAVSNQPQYRLIAMVPDVSSYGSSYFMIWSKRSP